MEWVENFFFQNLVLIFLCLALLVSAIVRYKQQAKTSLFIILIVTCTLSLAVSWTLENYSKSLINPDLTLIFSVLGYTLRPTCIYLFILLLDERMKVRTRIFLSIPLVINLIIYSLSFAPSLKEYIVYFVVNDTGDEMSFGGGVLRFSAHVISAFYLIYLAYVSFSALRFKRLLRASVVIGCLMLVAASTVIESFFNSEGNIYLLNTSIAVATVIYYLFILIESEEIDETGLLKSESYYSKADNMSKIASGVIVFYIDAHTSSHDGITEFNTYFDVAHIIQKRINRKMLVFRVEEDKFVLIAFEVGKDMFESLFNELKTSIDEEGYKVNMGYGYKVDKNEGINELVFKAENMIEKNDIHLASSN